MHAFILSVIRDTRGATAIEYALIASLIAVVIAVAVSNVGTQVEGMFSSVASAF
ncbi:MAG TPA: Flp family type IVb pilin [Stellaceae bacterium]|nr:Flp family type IVb pilin [Stellaceae bacterium]